jgi:iron complex transport system substrate-binding protein
MGTKTLFAILACSCTALTACGSDESSESTSSAGATAESGAFPVTIEHKYGSTTIDKAPKRVVVVGLRDQDALLALGVVPVATTEWYGKQPGAIFPWAKDELGDAKPPVVLSSTDGIEIEKVAAQQPDLILGVYSGITKKEYTALSKLAPVVAQPKHEPDYGSSWQEETLTAGKAVGRADEAQKLVDDTEKLVADTAAKNSVLKGKTVAMVADYQGIFVYGPKDVRSRVLEELGMQYPKALLDAFPKEFGGQLSDEKTDALDVGVLVWFADGERSREEIKKDPLYSKLDVNKQDRDVFIGGKDRVYNATSFVSVLSMPTLMKELVPRLAAAADGDPATSTDQQPASG